MAKIDIDLQIVTDKAHLPSTKTMKAWIKTAVQTNRAEITLRIVDEAESSLLNKQYRHKAGPTNVLSFPFSDEGADFLEGDIVICAPIVFKEAMAQHKSLAAHFAHLIIHGTLHLQGFDHIDDEDARLMKQQEVTILA